MKGRQATKALGPEFFAAEPIVVARGLIGAQLRRDAVLIRISEVEAYGGPEDSASHARFGRTARNAPMWGPPGCLYIYLCYGLHQMLNLVTGPQGVAGAILVRACEPLHGLEHIRERRGGQEGTVLLTGPGKVGAALALDRSWSGRPLGERGGLELFAAPEPVEVLRGPRVGITFATAADRAAPCRFAAADSDWVTHRAMLHVDSFS